MNEELQQAVATLVQRVIDGTDNAADFLSAELPEYITQLLMWYGWYNFIMFGVGVLLIFLWYYIEKRVAASAFATETDKDGDKRYIGWIYDSERRASYSGDGGMVYFLVGSIIRFILVFIIFIGMINIQWLKIWIAPKVWLVDYAIQLSKSAGG